MEVMVQGPLHDKQQLAQWLQSRFPQYRVEPSMHGVIVGDGLATGVLVRDMGGGRARLIWEFPNMGAKMALMLSIVLTGILPGLIAYGIVWASTKDNVARMIQEVAGALTGMAPSMGMAPGMGMAPPAPSGGGKGMAVTFGLLTLMAGGYGAYAYSEYDSARSSSYRSSSYGSSYGRYGSYNSYGDRYYAIISASRMRRWRERYEMAGAAAAFFALLTVVGLVRAGSNKGGAAPQQQGFGPGPQGFAQQGFAPQQPGFASGPQGFAPQQPGFAPQPPGFASGPQGFAPQQGYPPQQGFAQQQGPQGGVDPVGATMAMPSFGPGGYPGPQGGHGGHGAPPMG